jgi:hypothetical protein
MINLYKHISYKVFMKKDRHILGLLAISRQATDKEEAFFDFLMVSPSFQLAHMLRTHGLPKDESIVLPPDFDRVLGIYDLCGNIYETDFEDWWEERGRDLLRSNSDNGTLIAYPADLTQPTNKLIDEFTAFIRQAKADREDKKLPAIKFLTNKVRISALHARLALVNDKGRIERKTGKKISNWRLGVEVKIKSKWADELLNIEKNTNDNLEARTTLGILVSKHLKEALYLAENAARGIFPLLDPIDSGLSFDYAKTWALGNDQIKLAHKSRQNKIKAGVSIRKTYYERKIKPMLKRQKAIEAMVNARLLLHSE